MGVVRRWAGKGLERLGQRALAPALSEMRDALRREDEELVELRRAQQRLAEMHRDLLASFLAPRDRRLDALQGPAQREFERLKSMASGERGVTHILGFPLRFLDGPMFMGTYSPIFVQEIYGFASRRPDPRILDCGANIGLATLYWKRAFPRANIVAFEPEPVALEALRANLDHAGITDVDVVPAAVWTSETTIELSQPTLGSGHVDSRIVELESSGSVTATVPVPTVPVPTVRLRDYLLEPVDFLKLDIEGAETDVVLDCADRLGDVSNLFVEYHGFVGKPSRLVELLSAVERAGFSVFIEQEHGLAMSPLIERPDRGGMDVQLNLFCYRA